MTNSQIKDFSEIKRVELRLSDWSMWVTIMTDSVNKMKEAIKAAGKDPKDYHQVEILATIRDEIAQQVGLKIPGS